MRKPYQTAFISVLAHFIILFTATKLSERNVLSTEISHNGFNLSVSDDVTPTW